MYYLYPIYLTNIQIIMIVNYQFSFLLLTLQQFCTSFKFSKTFQTSDQIQDNTL